MKLDTYKDIMETMIDLSSIYTALEGYIDLVKNKDCLLAEYNSRGFDKDSYFIKCGRNVSSDDMIVDAFIETPFRGSQYNINGEGVYKFNALLKHNSGDYDECGRIVGLAYMDIEYIEFEFISTFEQREREIKLSNILNEDMDSIFNSI